MLWMEEVSLKKHPRTLFQKTIFCPQIHFDENVSFWCTFMSQKSEFLAGKTNEKHFFRVTYFTD